MQEKFEEMSTLVMLEDHFWPKCQPLLRDRAHSNNLSLFHSALSVDSSVLWQYCLESAGPPILPVVGSGISLKLIDSEAMSFPFRAMHRLAERARWQAFLPPRPTSRCPLTSSMVRWWAWLWARTCGWCCRGRRRYGCSPCWKRPSTDRTWKLWPRFIPLTNP